MQPTPATTRRAGVPINGPLICRMRQNAGMAQADLALRARISAAYVCHIERGRRETVSAPVFKRLCTALGVANDPERIRSDRLLDAA